MDPLLDGGLDGNAPGVSCEVGFFDPKLFGTLDLAALEVTPLDDPSREVQRLSLHDSNTPEAGAGGKRGRSGDDEPRVAASNKMANTEPGDPVPLPAYG